MPPRRIRNVPARTSLLPRRNPGRPGMGGANLPKRNAPLGVNQHGGFAGGFWQGLPGSPENDTGGRIPYPGMPGHHGPPYGWPEGPPGWPFPGPRGGGGDGGGQPMPDGGDPRIRQLLEQMGLAQGAKGTLPTGQQGFGFNSDQRQGIGSELERIRQYQLSHPNAQMNDQQPFNPNLGIAGQLQNWEQGLGMAQHDIGPFGANQQQQNAFAHAFSGGYPQAPPPQHLPPGPLGPRPPETAGQMPYATDGAGQFPGQFSPGNPHQQQPQYQPPQSFSPGNPHMGAPQQYAPPPGYQPQPQQYQSSGGPMPYFTPQQQQAPQQYPQQYPQGGMPPFARGGTSPQQGAAPQQAPQQQQQFAGAPNNPSQIAGFDFSNFRPPGNAWGQATGGLYGELAQPPPNLTGANYQQWQGYLNQFNQGMQGLQSQYGQIAPNYNEQGQRLATNYGVERTGLEGNLADRGIFNSGVANSAVNNQITDYNRQFTDLQNATNQQYGDIFNQANQMLGLTNDQLYALMNQNVQQRNANPYSPYPNRQPKKGQKKGGK